METIAPGQSLTVNENQYWICELLGKGKSGYSWLAEKDGKQVVIKQIHHEPCDYYSFGNKLESELSACQRLKELQVPIPALLDVDEKQERIVKEYIEGPTILALKETQPVPLQALEQVQQLSARCRSAGFNIDWYPANFILHDQKLYYIDYEVNPFMEEWSYEIWGCQFWY